VNAAFLLMTTAMMAGADTPAQTPAQTAKPPAAAPVYSVGTGGCANGGCAGCGTCDSCGCESEGFFSKLKGHFHHSSDCGCGCESEGFFSKFKGKMHHGGGCGCETGCGGCGSSCGGCGSACDSCGGHGGFGGKLRGLFHKRGSDCGCDTCGGCSGCSGSSGYGGVITTVPGGTMKPEPIGNPKGDELRKLPSDDNKGTDKKQPGSVQLIPQPVNAPALDITPTTGKSPY